MTRTVSLIIIATYTQSMYASVCVEAVEKLGINFSLSNETDTSIKLTLILFIGLYLIAIIINHNYHS